MNNGNPNSPKHGNAYSRRVRKLNDQLRMHGEGGRVMVTRGIADEPPEVLERIMNAVRRYDVFNEENDPHDHARQRPPRPAASSSGKSCATIPARPSPSPPVQGNSPPGTVLGRITSGGKYTVLTPGASNGSQNAAGLLWGAADATDADGGAARSKHLDGTAFDIAMSKPRSGGIRAGSACSRLPGVWLLSALGALSISISDPRGPGAGGSRCERQHFAEETPPVRETLADSRTMKGSSAAD